MNKKLLYLFLCMMFFAKASYAQKLLKGRIIDYYTNQAYQDTLTQVFLLTSDSTTVDSGYVGPEGNIKTGKTEIKYYFQVEREGDYIIKCTNPNCETAYYPLSIKFYKREDEIEGKDIRLKKKISKSLDLPEVLVEATKLKFYFSNDTLVYNAETFATQYGFVLNDLLRKMPGISVGPNYEIYSNGRKVDELLLNGKNFFNGDRETLIENLPAYMIKNIKIYEHVDSLELLKSLDKQPPLALDVKLKKGYNSTTVGNVDLGVGTDDRYYGRLFGMRIHDLYRWTAYAVSNNTNHNEQIDHNGQLYNMDNGTGDKKFHVAGLNYNVDSRSDAYRIEGYFRIQGSKEKQTYRQMDDVFLSDGDAYAFTSKNTKAQNFSVQTSHTFDLFPRKKYNLTISPAFVHVRSKVNVDMAQLNANENIADMICGSWADSIRSKSLGEKLLMFGVNRVLNKKYTPTHSTQMSLNANQSYRIPHTPDYVGLELTGLYTTQSTDSYEHYGVNYITSPQKANRWKNLYLDNRLKDFQWSAKASYTTLQKNVHTIGIHASFALEYFNVDKNNYNLATLSGWGMDTEYELGMLPSQQALLGTLEKGNSYSYREHLNRYTLGINYALEFHGHTFEVSVPLSLQRRNLDFYQSDNEQVVTRRMFSPDITIKLRKWMSGNTGSSYSLNFSTKKSMPALFNLVNQRSDIYEVAVTQGNENLKNATSYTLNGSYNWRPVLMHSHAISVSYNYYRNKVGTAIYYDKTNGKYLYTPRNINGNQDFSAILNNSFYLDKSYKHKLSNVLSYTYIQSVDFSGASEKEYENKSTVHNSVVSEKMEYMFTSRNTKCIGTIAPYLTFHRSVSQRLGFESINAFLYGLQASARIELPASIRFNTELRSESRRGYNDHSMNDNELIWNMGLTKSFRNNITLSLNAVDILGQRKNIYKVVTAQATTESVSNVLRRHVMFHFIWQFSSKKTNK
mgnify:FL=1